LSLFNFRKNGTYNQTTIIDEYAGMTAGVAYFVMPEVVIGR